MRTAKHGTHGKHVTRRVSGLELTQLRKDELALKTATEAVEDATIALDAARAAFDVVALPAKRRATALWKRYRMRAEETINLESGAIETAPTESQ
jgi:hypothetical protein